MQKMNLVFGGMSIAPDAGVSKDGDMHLLINMRHKGSDLVPRKEIVENVEKFDDGVNIICSVVKYHSANGHRLAIISNGQIFYDLTDKKHICFGFLPGEDGYTITDFAIMGNIIVLYRKDKKGISVEPIYVIYRGGEYVLLGVLPKAPRLSFTMTTGVKSVTTTEKYYLNLRQAREANAEDLYNEYVKKGFFDNVLNQWYVDGGYIDRALFRVALRLFDGSYISYSPIYFTEYSTATADGNGSGGRNNFKWGATDGTTALQTFYAKIAGYTLEYIIEEYDWSAWRDVILSVDLFTTGSLPYHEAKKTQGTRTSDSVENITTREYEDYVLLENSEIISSITTADRFYKIGEFDLLGKQVYIEKNTSPSELAVKTLLPGNYSHSSVGGKNLLYNNKLHIYDFENRLFDGYYDLRTWFNSLESLDQTKEIKEITVVTSLSTDDGIKKVLAKGSDLGRFPEITPYLVYPDARATQMDVYIKYKLGDEEHTVHRSFPLTAHKTLDIAYHIYTDEAANVQATASGDFIVAIYSMYNIAKRFNFIPGEYNITYNGSTEKWMYDGNEFPYKENPDDRFTSFGILGGAAKDGDTITFTIKNDANSVYGYTSIDYTTWEASNGYEGDVDAIEKRNGVMRVSSVDNPFYFPTMQSYKFEGSIVGIASNTDALSQGQFGQYPLFVFTDEGIWAMQVDTSGKGAYVTQTPFSREVCNGGVLPVAGGVVFTTERGVMLISGGEVIDISAQLDADAVMQEFFAGNEGMWEMIFGKAGIGYTFEPAGIREYVVGAVLAYNYLSNEVIISNKEYLFSYCYDLTTGMWSVIDVLFNATTNSYPELVVYDNSTNESKQIVFTDNESSIGVVAVTRPIKAETFDFKRLRQAALRCYFTGCLNFYVLGSNDAMYWNCITGKEYPSKNGTESVGAHVRDLITTMSRSRQYKYILVAVAGEMRGSISIAELLVDGSFANNKLR